MHLSMTLNLVYWTKNDRLACSQWRIQDFPLEGAPTRWGVPTSDAYTFQQKCMQKRKKLILLRGGARRRRPPWIRQW